MRYLFQGPQLVQSGHEPGLWELVYKYYRAHVEPDAARRYTHAYMDYIVKDVLQIEEGN